MASIVYAEIVGTRMAEEGQGGFTVNSTSYSVLLFYDIGNVELIEGNAKQIRPYLAYMRPHNDTNQINMMLSRFEEQLKKDISQIVENAVQDILFEQSNPLPTGITGKSREEAISILTDAGFRVELSPIAPDTTPGTVIECTRKTGDHMTVVLKIKYNMPDVNGMTSENALKQLQSAGFHVVIKRDVNDSVDDNHVFKVIRDGDSLDVILWVSDKKKNIEHTLANEINTCKSMKDIWEYWQSSELSSRYEEVGRKIKSKYDIERMYGKSRRFELEKKEICDMLLPR